MSQIFDSLRRGRKPPARQTSPRTAQGDVVLATLGYTAARPSRSYGSALVIAAIATAIALMGWLGWRTYFGDVEPSTPPRPMSPLTSVNRAPAAAPLRATPTTDGVGASKPEAAPTAPTTPKGIPDRASRIPDAGPRTPDSAPIAPPNDLTIALYFHRAGEFENALRYYRLVLDRDELNAQAHNNLGLLYQERGLLQDSARELKRALAIEPRNAGTHNNYGVTLLMLKRIDEAAAEFQAALALEPANLDALVNLGLAQRDAGQLDTAKETLLRALNRSPDNAAAHYNLAQLYDQTHEPARAVEHYRRFLEHAGVEHADRGAAVRARITALSRLPE